MSDPLTEHSPEQASEAVTPPEGGTQDTPAEPKPERPSMAAVWGGGAWDVLVCAAVVTIVAAQTMLTLDAREVWYSDEIRYAAAFREMLDGGHYWFLQLNGEPYPDKPPIYFWMLAGLSWLVGSRELWVMFLGSAVSGAAFILASYVLLKQVLGRAEASVAAALLMATPLVGALFQHVRMDLLFATAIALAQLCLFVGARRERNNPLIVAGFALGAVATLIKGPLGLAFPLVGLLTDVALRQRLGRLLQLDVLVGLAAVVGLIGGWAAIAAADIGLERFLAMMDQQVVQRATDAWTHRRPGWYYLAVLPLVWLPWTVLIGLPPIWRWLGSGVWLSLARRFQPDNAKTAGLLFLGITALGDLVLLSVLSGKLHIYLVPLLPKLAGLSAAAILALEPRWRARFWAAVGTVFGLLGLVVVTAGFSPDNPLPVPAIVLPALALVGLAGAVIALRRIAVVAPLLAGVVGMTAVMIVLGMTVGPALDAHLSPAKLGRIMAQYRDCGYQPIAYGVRGGTFTYYAGGPVLETSDPQAFREMVAEHQAVVVAIRRWSFDRAGAGGGGGELQRSDFISHEPVAEQEISGQHYILLAWAPDATKQSKSCP